MGFVSLWFLFIFLPVGVLLYAATPRKWKMLSLYVISVAYYWHSGPFYFGFMMVSVTIDYCLSRLMQFFDNNNKYRRAILAVGLVKNLGIGVIAGSGYELTPNIVPIGMYIYLFSALGYLIDVYKGDAMYEKNYIRFSLYCIMFPRLPAGPMLEYNAYLAQLKDLSFRLDQFSRGFTLFIFGFSKWVLILKGLREVTSALYLVPAGEMSLLSGWILVGCTALSYYYAFSSYGDMAEGLGIIFGFRYLSGYEYPLISESISSFWKRFNGSVTAFVRRYTTIQLSADTNGFATAAVHLIASSVLIGMWYSVNLNGMLWGLFLGIITVCEELVLVKFLQKIPVFFRRILTLLILMPSFLFLTCPDMVQFIQYIKILLGIGVPLFESSVGYTLSSYWLPLAAAVLFAAPLLRPVRRRLSPPSWGNGKREAKPSLASPDLIMRVITMGMTCALLFYSIIIML